MIKVHLHRHALDWHTKRARVGTFISLCISPVQSTPRFAPFSSLSMASDPPIDVSQVRDFSNLTQPFGGATERFILNGIVSVIRMMVSNQSVRFLFGPFPFPLQPRSTLTLLSHSS